MYVSMRLVPFSADLPWAPPDHEICQTSGLKPETAYLYKDNNFILYTVPYKRNTTLLKCKEKFD